MTKHHPSLIMKKKEPVAAQVSRKHILPAELTDRYELGPRLGSGGYGFVVSAVDRLTGQPCAVKFIYKRKIPSSSSQLPIEISLLQHTEHTNIILMESYFQDEVFFYLVMEAPHSTQDLFSCLEEHDYFSERLARHIFIQVVEAVLYLKQIGFYHRDIKDENILIDRSFNIKLIDFGSAVRQNSSCPTKMSHFHGTLAFASPEILKGQAYYPEPAEVWSLGVLLYTLLYGKVPFSTPLQVIQGSFHTPSLSTSKPGLHLLAWLFRKNPKHRPTLDQIWDHPWLSAGKRADSNSSTSS